VQALADWQLHENIKLSIALQQMHLSQTGLKPKNRSSGACPSLNHFFAVDTLDNIQQVFSRLPLWIFILFEQRTLGAHEP